MRKGGIGSHTRPNDGETNTWLTPPFVIEALGPFDLDPCAAPSPRPWPTALRHIELPEDGLVTPWRGPKCLGCGSIDEPAEPTQIGNAVTGPCSHCGSRVETRPYRVWMNPPYGKQTDAWLQRLAAHGGGTALIFARTETSTWTRWVWPYADSVLFLEGRLWFHRPDGTRGSSNAGGPSALISYDARETERLRDAVLWGRISGTHIHHSGWRAGPHDR